MRTFGLAVGEERSHVESMPLKMISLALNETTDLRIFDSGLHSNNDVQRLNDCQKQL